MSDAKLVNIARLMTTYNFEIEQLPDNLKCAQCKLVLKDACQLPCCCRYCRACIDDMILRGDEFCPGHSEECGESLLSRFVSHYEANKSVLRLTVKCPHNWCVHECQLARMEEHLQECKRKSEDCPFRELGCTQDKLAAEEMGGHLHHENRRHSEILIKVIANINREIETLKMRDEASSREIEMLKHELVLKDGQIRSIMDQMIHVQNENKFIKNEIRSIKEEKKDLAGRVRILSEDIERETAERRENDELDSARVIEHVDREIAAVTMVIGSNKDELTSQMQLVRGNIGSINQSVQLIKDDICSAKSQLQTIQAPVGQVDASFEWLIDEDVYKTTWVLPIRRSEYFYGEVHPYKYRLASWNCCIGTPGTALCIHLHIYAGPNDGQLEWPFEARVVITVTDRDRREVCRSISRQCRIERPSDNQCSGSNAFEFLHSELKKAGLNLSRGVRVSCMIVPVAG